MVRNEPTETIVKRKALVSTVARCGSGQIGPFSFFVNLLQVQKIIAAQSLLARRSRNKFRDRANGCTANFFAQPEKP